MLSHFYSKRQSLAWCETSWFGGLTIGIRSISTTDFWRCDLHLRKLPFLAYFQEFSRRTQSARGCTAYIHLTDQDAGSLINNKANIQPLIRRDMNYSIRRPLKFCPFLFQALIQNENVEIKLQQDVHNQIVGCIMYSREARENLLWKNLWEQNASQQCCFSQDSLQRRTPSHAICMLWPSLKLSNYTVCWMASRMELILRDI